MKNLLFLIFIVTCFNASAQDSLQNLNFSRNQIKKTGMEVLGTWAAANIVIGGIGWATTNGTAKYFHQMNRWQNWQHVISQVMDQPH